MRALPLKQKNTVSQTATHLTPETALIAPDYSAFPEDDAEKADPINEEKAGEIAGEKILDRKKRIYKGTMLIALLVFLIILFIGIQSNRSNPVSNTALDIHPSSECITDQNDVTHYAVPETETVKQKNGFPCYENADHVPMDMVFADREAFELIKTSYDELEFAGTFQTGDKSVYDYYREKFALLIEKKVTVYDSEGEKSFVNMAYNMEQYKNSNCKFYFFDMDGDSIPELCLEGVGGTFVCKYDAEADHYCTWWEDPVSGYKILGTGKIAGDHNGDQEYFFQLDGDGNIVFRVVFEISYRPERKYLISVPDSIIEDNQIPESVKKQIFYNEYRMVYCLRVTREQYMELIQGLHEARKLAEKEWVPLSYFLPDCDDYDSNSNPQCPY